MINKQNLKVITFALCQVALIYEENKTEEARDSLIRTLQQRVIFDSLEIRIIDLIAKSLIESGIHMGEIRLRDINSLKEKGGGAFIYPIMKNKEIVSVKIMNNFDIFSLLNDFIDNYK